MKTNVNNTTEPQHDAKLPVMPSFCECVYEYNDDHHGLLVWMCPKCEEEEEQNEA